MQTDSWSDFLYGYVLKRFIIHPFRGLNKGNLPIPNEEHNLHDLSFTNQKEAINPNLLSIWVQSWIQKVWVYDSHSNQIVFTGEIDKKPNHFPSFDPSLLDTCKQIFLSQTQKELFPLLFSFQKKDFYLLHILEDTFSVSSFSSSLPLALCVWIFKNKSNEGDQQLATTREKEKEKEKKQILSQEYILFLSIRCDNQIRYLLILNYFENTQENTNTQFLLRKFLCAPLSVSIPTVDYLSESLLSLHSWMKIYQFGWLLLPYLSVIQRYLSNFIQSKSNKPSMEMNSLTIDPSVLSFHPLEWKCLFCSAVCDCPSSGIEWNIRFLSTCLPYSYFLKGFCVDIASTTSSTSFTALSSSSSSSISCISSSSMASSFSPFSLSLPLPGTMNFSSSLPLFPPPPSSPHPPTPNHPSSSSSTTPIPSPLSFLVPAPTIASIELSSSSIHPSNKHTQPFITGVNPLYSKKKECPCYQKIQKSRPKLNAQSNTSIGKTNLIQIPKKINDFLHTLILGSLSFYPHPKKTMYIIFHEIWNALQQSGQIKIPFSKIRMAALVNWALFNLKQKKKIKCSSLSFSKTHVFPHFYPIEFEPNSLEYFIYEQICAYSLQQIRPQQTMKSTVQNQCICLMFYYETLLDLHFPSFTPPTFLEILLYCKKVPHLMQITFPILEKTLIQMIRKGLLGTDCTYSLQTK